MHLHHKTLHGPDSPATALMKVFILLKYDYFNTEHAAIRSQG